MRRFKWESIYYTPSRAGSLGGARALSRVAKKSLSETRNWLITQDAYTLHKPVRYKFKRRRVISGGIGHQWQCDVIDTSNISKHNDDYKFLLTCVDVFSRKAYVIPLKSKSNRDVLSGFRSIKNLLNKSGKKLPFCIQTDRGKEFLGAPVQTWFKDNHIKFFVSENDDIKCSLVERFNRTLKNRLWRHFTGSNTLKYTDILDDLVQGYNDSYHRAIKMAPNHVTARNSAAVWKKLHPIVQFPKSKFKVGDSVRISKTRRVFRKGYLPQWSEEIFTLSKRLNTNPVTWKLRDWNDEVLHGSFYEPEIQKVVKVESDVYVIENVLKRKKNRLFVKWRGYPDKFNSWVDVNDVRKL